MADIALGRAILQMIDERGLDATIDELDMQILLLEQRRDEQTLLEGDLEDKPNPWFPPYKAA